MNKIFILLQIKQILIIIISFTDEYSVYCFDIRSFKLLIENFKSINLIIEILYQIILNPMHIKLSII